MKCLLCYRSAKDGICSVCKREVVKEFEVKMTVAEINEILDYRLKYYRKNARSHTT